MLLPRRLAPGDTVAAISLSWGGPADIPHRYEAGKAQFEQEFGLRVQETEHALADAAFLAQHPEVRWEDWRRALLDPEIAGVIATIGGEDSVRLLPYVDFEVLRDHPKAFLGFSDSTVSHLMCQRAGLASFYGPSLMSDFAENCGMLPFVADCFRRTLMTPEPAGEFAPHGGWTVQFLDWNVRENQATRRTFEPPVPPRYLQGTGKHVGHVLGGCMEVLEFVRGTALWPSLEDWDGALLLLETSEEAPSTTLVRRWLRGYGSMGVLERVNGILFGRPGGGVPAERFQEYDECLLGVVRDELGLTDLAIVTCLDIGHTSPCGVLPLGVRSEIDCDARRLTVLDAAVRA